MLAIYADAAPAAAARAETHAYVYAYAYARHSDSGGPAYVPYDPPPYAYAVTAGCAGIALLAGAFLANTRLQLTSWGQLLYHKTLAAPPRSKAWLRLCGPVAELTYGEAAALLLFGGTVATYGAYYYENALARRPGPSDPAPARPFEEREEPGGRAAAPALAGVGAGGG
eukprot:tig00000826_g4570.t1